MTVQADPLTSQLHALSGRARLRRVAAISEPAPVPSLSEVTDRRATSSSRAKCDVCDERARVLILEGYAEGQPVLRHFCLTCAEAARAETRAVGERPRLGLHVLVAMAGLVFGVVGALGDFLIPPAHAGFGWYQQGGVVAGVMILLTGLLLRADVVALGGAFLLGVSLGADWMGLTRGPGIGWKQQVMVAVGAACLLAAGLIRLRIAARLREHTPRTKHRANALPDSALTPGAAAPAQ